MSVAPYSTGPTGPTGSDSAPPVEELSRMSLIQHLEELRRRIFSSLAFFAVAFCACWVFHSAIFNWLQAPMVKLLHGRRLAFMGIIDPFMLYLKVSALAALFVSAPFLLFQLWLFISPGLYRREKGYVAPFVLFGTLFFMSGGAFGYYFAFPYAAGYLLDLGRSFEPVITIERYFGFFLAVILGLAVMFELPIVIFVICRLGLVTPRFLMRHFRYAVVIIFILAAILTPTPDVFSMCAFALPMLVLYLLGVGAAALADLTGKRQAAAT